MGNNNNGSLTLKSLKAWAKSLVQIRATICIRNTEIKSRITGDEISFLNFVFRSPSIRKLIESTIPPMLMKAFDKGNPMATKERPIRKSHR